MIPARIIQTGPARLPLRLQAAMTGVKLLHPDFEYVFFDDARVESFMAEQLPEHRRAFEQFHVPIQKFDFFRYLAVYRLGGFYLDLDVFLVRDLIPLQNSECVFPFEELTWLQHLCDHYAMDWQIGNYGFGAEAGHPLLAAIIENCVRSTRDPSWVSSIMKGLPWMCREDFYVLCSTGPGLVSRTFAENPPLQTGVTILFPDDVCESSTWHQFGDFGVHQMAASWRGSANFVARRLRRIWEIRRLHQIVSAARKKGRTRRALPPVETGRPV
jgi:inositol phosphorylceramide mannosyltransferase catalytic subunit